MDATRSRPPFKLGCFHHQQALESSVSVSLEETFAEHLYAKHCSGCWEPQKKMVTGCCPAGLPAWRGSETNIHTEGQCPWDPGRKEVVGRLWEEERPEDE